MADPEVVNMVNKPAVKCLAVLKKIDEDRLFMKVGEVLGASSQTLEETFLTAIRTRMAEIKGPRLLG